MSFLDKLKGVFSGEEKKDEHIQKEVKEDEIILAPITGEVKDIKECVDPVFFPRDCRQGRYHYPK